MPVGGPTVGEAYIKILVDGTGVGKRIEKELKDAAPTVRRAGSSMGTEVKRGFDRGMEDFGRDFSRQLDLELHRSRGVVAARASQLGKQFSQSIADAAGEDEVFRRALERQITEGIIRGTINSETIKQAQDGGRTHGKHYGIAFEKEMAAATLETYRHMERIEEQERKKAIQSQIAHQRELEKVIVTSQEKFFKDRPGADIAGRIFGKNARNDLLHFMGGLAQGVARLVYGIVDIVGFIGKGLGTVFKKVFGGVFEVVGNLLSDMAAAFVDKFPKIAAIVARMGTMIGGTFGRIAGPIGAVILVVVALATALYVLLSAIGVVVVAITGFVGAVTALAAALSLGIIGGVTVLATAMGALGIAAIATGIAMTGVMDAIKETDPEEYAKKLAELTPAAQDFVKYTRSDLIPAFKDIRENLQQSFFVNIIDSFKTAVPKVLPVIKNLLNEAILGMATGISNVFKIFSGPQVLGNINTIASGIGTIITNLVTAIGHVGAGLSTIFASAMPFLQQFAAAVAGAALQFSTWLHQAATDGSLHNFFRTAWEVAKTIWDIIKTIGLIIWEVFSSGAGTGTGFLDSIRDKVKWLLDYLKTPAGKSKMADFFEQAKGFARDVWDFLVKVGVAWDKFNSPENQAKFSRLIDLGGDFITFLSDAAFWLEQVVTFFRNLVTANLGGIIGQLGEIVNKLRGANEQKDAWNRAPPMALAPGTYRPPSPGRTAGDAAGRLVTGPTMALVGEAGPEAIVPLRRPLSRVDPAVRALSAIAQNKSRFAAGGVVGAGTVLNEGAIQIITPAKNPEIVASMVLDRMILVGMK
jgi:hypothetical protein